MSSISVVRRDVTSLTTAKKWRRGWDSNPRYACAHTRFPVVPDRPLQHLSAAANRMSEAPHGRGQLMNENGGEGGIRTHEAHRLPLFESGTFNHSDTSPQ